jgi:hypothetical protein
MLMPVFLLLFPGASAWETPSSAEACGRCHRAIYESWKTSGHAQAYKSRLFQDVLERAEADFGAKGREACLTCHAPVSSQAADGVLCDYCHSIHQVTFDGRNPKAAVTFSSAKTGPLSGAANAPHQNVYSPIYATSAICAPCHDYRNSAGFPVMTTYSEWQNGPYGKRGRACQSCHMARTASKTNLHEMPGGHSVGHLAGAIKARVSTSRKGAYIEVGVEVENEGAGHYFPTGSPLREMVLEVRADSAGGQHFREQRLYARQVADQHGTVLMREHFAFLRAAKAVSDTRLAPGEKRMEKFVFAIPEGDPAKVDATLWYVYSPLAKTESETRVAFLTLHGSVR